MVMAYNLKLKESRSEKSLIRPCPSHRRYFSKQTWQQWKG